MVDPLAASSGLTDSGVTDAGKAIALGIGDPAVGKAARCG